MIKEYQSKKKENKQQYFKCDKEEHIAKDCKWTQLMKKQKIQEESDDEDNNKKEEGFGDDLK